MLWFALTYVKIQNSNHKSKFMKSYHLSLHNYLKHHEKSFIFICSNYIIFFTDFATIQQTQILWPQSHHSFQLIHQSLIFDIQPMIVYLDYQKAYYKYNHTSLKETYRVNNKKYIQHTYLFEYIDHNGQLNFFHYVKSFFSQRLHDPKPLLVHQRL